MPSSSFSRRIASGGLRFIGLRAALHAVDGLIRFRGVDVGAIEFIHRQLLKQRSEGKAILLISLELEEIRSLSDRILVIYAGRIVGEVGPDATDEELGLLMAGHDIEKKSA